MDNGSDQIWTIIKMILINEQKTTFKKIEEAATIRELVGYTLKFFTRIIGSIHYTLERDTKKREALLESLFTYIRRAIEHLEKDADEKLANYKSMGGTGEPFIFNAEIKPEERS